MNLKFLPQLTVFEKEKEKELCKQAPGNLHQGPWNYLGPCISALGRPKTGEGHREGGAGWFPAARLAGGEGKVGK